MTMKAPTANSMATAAMPTAKPKVASPGRISMKSRRTTMTASTATASANKASRRAQMARRETGSSGIRRRRMRLSGSCANSLQRRPFGRRKQRVGLYGRSSVDGGKAVACIGVVDEKAGAGMIGTLDTYQNRAERARVAADPAHQVHGESVGAALDLARIGRLQERTRRHHHGAAADEVAEHHAEQERQPGRLHDGARAVALGHVSHLVGDGAGKLVGALRLADQAIENVDASARHREGI